MTIDAASFATLSTPTLPSLSLSESEKSLIAELHSMRSTREKVAMRLSEAYYLGEQVIDNLRIAVPEELEFLRTIVGWASLAVDPYVERHAIDGFRLPNATDADARLGDMFSMAGLDAELPLAITDALSLGRGYWLVGTGEDPELPKVTVESPLNMSVKWDLAGRVPKAALSQYWDGGRHHASLMVPGKTTHLATDDSGLWVVVNRDEHDFDFVPVVRMPHGPRTTARDGRSAITPAIRSTIDSACRDLLALEVSRELYSVPGITLLGAAEADFVNADGTAQSAWDAYITRVRAMERDEEGNLPSIHQAQVYDPSVFTKLIDMRAASMGSLVAAPPQDLGLYTQGNPTSAEAAEVAEGRRNRRARLQQRSFGRDVVDVMQMMLRFANKGTLPEEFRRIEVSWCDLDETPMGVSSDAISKQIASGAVPATSDVTLSKLGYTATERRRLEQDRNLDDGRQAGREIADALTRRRSPDSGSTGL